MVGHADHVGVVLDDEHRVALVPQLPEDVDEALVVPRMQPDRGLVEHVECADQRRSERRRQVDPLRLAPGERRREPVEREIVEPHVAQEREAAADLAQQLVGHRRVLLAEGQPAEEPLRLLHREPAHLVDGAIPDAHVPRFAPQARAVALGAGQVAAVPAQEDPDVHLVLLALQPAEEAADALERRAVAVEDEALLLGGQVAPRHVEPEARRLRRPLQLREVGAVVRLAPRLDRMLVDRLRGVGHHQIHVDLDDVAEAVADRARAVRVVEREQARLRVLVGDAARPALEPFRERVQAIGKLHRERRAAALAVGRLNRVREAALDAGLDDEPVHDHVQLGPARQRRRVHLVERRGPAIHQEAAVALPAERLEGVGHRRRRGPEGHDGHVEAQQDARARGQGRQARRHHLGRLAHHLLAALPAPGPADAGIEQPQVVVEFGGRGDRRSGVPDAVLLADGDGRRHAVDGVDVGLLHPLQELAGVGRQRLDVPPLALGVNRVEGERRLPRAADAGDDGQASVRQLETDVLQVVGAGPADDDPRRLGTGLLAHRHFRPTAGPVGGSLNEQW